MKFKTWIVMGFICSGLLSGCTTIQKPACQIDCHLKNNKNCARYSCVDPYRYPAGGRRNCGNYWHTTCHNLCNCTGANFCPNDCQKCDKTPCCASVVKSK